MKKSIAKTKEKSLKRKAKVTAPKNKVVRLWDMFDGWINISKHVTEKEAMRIWNERTCNGTRNTCYNDGDYYKIFDADTHMLMTPEYLGR